MRFYLVNLIENLSKMRFPLSINSALAGYAFVILFLSLTDALMAYITPVYLDIHLGNPFLMGIVLSTSSLVGLFFDFYSGERFRKKPYTYFLWMTFLLAFAFPLTLLFLPPIIPVFVLALSFWGIYYELHAFSHFNFIHKFTSKEDHNKAWGTVSAVKSLAYLMGPLIAIRLIDLNLQFPFKAALIILSIGVLMFLVFSNSKGRPLKIEEETAEDKRFDPKKEAGTWKVLFKRIWPLWLFTFAIMLIDATYWSVGAVFSEELRHLDPIGGFLLVAYTLPAVVFGITAQKYTLPTGKKRTAFASGLIAGVLLISLIFISEVKLLIIVIFTSSIFLAIAVPHILAAYEDYVARLGLFANDLVGLERASESIAYILGPPFAGFVAYEAGFQSAFAVAGGVMVIIAVVNFLKVPRKLKMPQKELKEQSENSAITQLI